MLGAIWFSGILLHELHSFVVNPELDPIQSTTEQALSLFLTVLNLFIDLCRIMVIAQDVKSGKNYEAIWDTLKSTGKHLLSMVGFVTVVYYMLTDTFCKYPEPSSNDLGSPTGSDKFNDYPPAYNSSHTGPEESYDQVPAYSP